MKKVLWLISAVSIVFCTTCPAIAVAKNDITGYEYVHKSTDKSSHTSWTHTATNKGNTTDTVSYSVSHTVSTSANVTVSGTFKSMVAEAGVSTMVGLGVSTTKTITCTFTIPKKSTYKLSAGTKIVKESGVEKRYVSGNLIKTKAVSAKWVYSTWSKKEKI